MIHVIAFITAKSGKRDELFDAFSQVVPLVHAEKGCIEYQPVTDSKEPGSQAKLGPDSYMVIEKWNTMADLRAHAASDHTSDYGKRTTHLVEDRKVYVLT